MSGTNIETQVRSLLSEIALTDEPRHAGAAAALDEVGIDSVGMIDLVYRLEDSFGIEIADEEVTPENFASIGALVDLVTRKCSS